MELIIVNAIRNRQRVKIWYGDKQYNCVELYTFGYNTKGAALLRVFDIEDNKFKLLRMDKLKRIEVRPNDVFPYLRPDYRPNKDSQISRIIICVK